MTSAVWDLAELLVVLVDERTGVVVDIADGRAAETIRVPKRLYPTRARTAYTIECG